MKQFLWSIALLLAVVLAMAPAAARADVIGFDDLGPNVEQIPNGYKGFNWPNFFTLNPLLDVDPNSGYFHGMVSPPRVAFNAFANPADVVSLMGPFDFNGAYLTGAWNDGLQITVQGLLGATMLYNTTITASDTQGPAKFFDFEYLGIDRLHFVSFGGVPHPGLNGQGTHLVLDNFTFNVPEPGTLALCAVALGILSGLGLRRPRKG